MYNIYYVYAHIHYTLYMHIYIYFIHIYDVHIYIIYISYIYIIIMLSHKNKYFRLIVSCL